MTGASFEADASQRLASHELVAVLLRARQRPQVAAFEALRWHTATPSPSDRLLGRSSSSKAVPLVRRCRRTTKELRAQLSLCREAFISSNEVAEQLLLGKRPLPRPLRVAEEDPAQEVPEPSPLDVGCELHTGGAAGSSSPPSTAGAFPAPDEQLEPATVWHPPGNEDEAMWRELALLVEGLREENPKWANCLGRVVKRLEASHTACRKQRDCLMEGHSTDLKPRSSSTELESGHGTGFKPRSISADLESDKLEKRDASFLIKDEDEIIFAGYGRGVGVPSVTAGAGTGSTSQVASTPPDRGSSLGCNDSLDVAMAALGDLACAASPQVEPQCEDRQSTQLTFGPAQPLQMPSGRLPSPLVPAVGPPQRAPQRSPPQRSQQQPVPSVQISLLGERCDHNEAASFFSNASFGPSAASNAAHGSRARGQEPADAPSSTSDSTSESGGDDALRSDRGPWSAGQHTGPLLIGQNSFREQAILASESRLYADRVVPPLDGMPVQRLRADTMTLTSKVCEMLGTHLPHGTSQNGFEGAGAALGSDAVPGASAHGSSPSLGSNLAAASGVVWPPAALYTPRSTVAAMHSVQGPSRGQLGPGDDAGERHEGLLDNLSRSATSLLPHPYTPRQKPATRIGMAPLRNQTSRTGSLRYPPNPLTRPFGVQRMASGTLGQPSTPHCSGVSRQTPVSASPARAHGYQHHAQSSVQWPGTARPASAMVPAAGHPSSGSMARSGGVSRQSSIERTDSALRRPPAPFAPSHSSVWPSVETFAPFMSVGALGLATSDSAKSSHSRRPSFPGGSGGASGIPQSSRSSVDSNAAMAPQVSSAPRNAPPVPKLPTNGITSCFNSKGAPPPQTLPQGVGGKGYSSIQLWTPRSQRQPGSDAKQAAVSREPRDLSVEPPQVGRSPSASLSTMSPRSYPNMNLHGAALSAAPGPGSAPSTLIPKLAAWRA